MLDVVTSLAEQLGAALRVVRSSTGVTQGDLARRIARPQSYISEWESGRKLIPLERIFDVEEALGLAKGTVLARAGFVDLDVTARDLLVSDPALDPEDRELLVGLYERARIRARTEGDGIADHS